MESVFSIPRVLGVPFPTLSPPLTPSVCDTGDAHGLLTNNFHAHQLPPVRQSINTGLLRGGDGGRWRQSRQ